jgi:methyltransferase family protein
VLPWEDPEALIVYQSALANGKPYFGAVCQADQGSDNFRFFSQVVDLVKSKMPLNILEVGSWAGASLAAWDAASDYKALLFAVDTWAPYLTEKNDLYDMMNKAAAAGEVEKLFWHNAKACNFASRLTAMKGESREILPSLTQQFDIVYIDGCHLYEVIKEDIYLSKSLVKNGGILCGDDLDRQLPKLPLDEHLALLARGIEAGVLPSGASYHVGVTQAVYDFFGIVSCYNGFWLVQKVDDSWKNVVLSDWNGTWTS